MTPYWTARRPRMEKDQDGKERLAAYLKELHLPAFRTSYEELARQAQQEGLSFEQYLLAFGPPGSGKTHLLSALGQELARLGRRVLFRKCGLLVQDLLAAKRD